MRPCHRENVCRLIDHGGSERLAAKAADVHAFFFTNLHGIETGRLAADCVYPRRGYCDVFPISQQAAKKPFRDGTAANVSCADKENAFHDSGSASERYSNLELNMPKSIC